MPVQRTSSEERRDAAVRRQNERNERNDLIRNEANFLEQIQGIRGNERAAQVIQGHEQNIARMQADLQRHAAVNRALRAAIEERAAAVRAASAKSSGTKVSFGNNDDDEVTSKRPKYNGGATHIHNGRSYKVHTGSKGGKYIVSKGKKIYV